MGAVDDEIVRIGQFRRGDDLVHGGIWLAVGDIGGDGVVEHDGVLIHDADHLPQRSYRIVADIHAVDGYDSGVDVVKACQQIGDGGLAGTGLADHGDHAAARDLERNGVEHDPLLIREADVPHGYALVELFEFYCIGLFGQRGVGVEQCKITIRRGHRLL